MKLRCFSLTQSDTLDQLLTHGATAVGCLQEKDRLRLLEEARDLEMTVAEKTYGAHNVEQDFSFHEGHFGSSSAFTDLRMSLEERLKRDQRLFPKFSGFNEIYLNFYKEGSAGIGIHRDHARYHSLVFIVVLEGHGTFATFQDRAGNGEHRLDPEPGDAIIMRAPGFCGTKVGPFHTIKNVTKDRTVVTLRSQIILPPDPLIS